MSVNPDRREFTRVQVKLEAELVTGGKVLIKGTLGDLSMKGMYLHCGGTLPVDSTCQVMLILDGGQGALCVQATGHVQRVDEDGLAIQFTEILGNESALHLQNLVLLNSKDEVQTVEQEFREHVGLIAKE